MPNLRDRFNDHARKECKRRKAERQRDADFFTLWMILLLLIELERQCQRGLENLRHQRFTPN